LGAQRHADLIYEGSQFLSAFFTVSNWLWGNGSVAAITRTIVHGVPKPKNHTGAMPPVGGVQLSQADLAAVADYVWAIGHQNVH
jgi:mono/diheme cytochrome c family protein